jgi:nucleotide-binding universal stress UspA family protein
VIRFSRILCPVDFSPFARHALDHAAVLARWYEAELTVLHVSPSMPTMFAPEPGLNAATLAPFDKESLRRDLNAFVGDLRVATGALQLVLRPGAAATEILRHAAETKADLVVLGTHGRTGFEHFMLGSVTEKVVRKALCPVLTVPSRAAGHSEGPLFGRILCGVDFSETSDQAVRYALSLAQEAKGRLTFLHALEWLPDRSLAEYPQFDLEQYRRSLISDARTRLEALVPEEARNWCEAAARVAYGKPYQEILRAAKEEAADLIVAGTHGSGPLDRMLFGSTAQHLVRQATCPVLTIRQ